MITSSEGIVQIWKNGLTVKDQWESYPTYNTVPERYQYSPLTPMLINRSGNIITTAQY